MNTSRILQLVVVSIISLSFIGAEPPMNNDPEAKSGVSLKSAIEATNIRVGTDSVFLSSFYLDDTPEQFEIADHLVLVNDLNEQNNLMSKDFSYVVDPNGHLELVGFDLHRLEANLINKGKISLRNCVFEEGRNLNQWIMNRGAFRIHNGLFLGSKEGDIIRTVVFRPGASLTL